MASELYEKGLRMRREVLGDSLAPADDFNRSIQETVLEYCWGAVWTRPGLPKKTRSLINIALLAALNRQHELKLHVRGALTNGCSEAEISEVLLQTMIYCGVPAGVDGARIAREEIAAVKASKGQA